MRGGVEGLRPPRSLAGGLPVAFFGNDFSRELIGAFDEVLAPIFTTLDDLDAYLDPRYAPEDFLRWLTNWLGVVVDERWPADRIRSHLADARQALLLRGTVAGVRAAVRAYTGHDPEVSDTGGVSWSARPGGEFPGSPRPQLTVRIDDPDGVVDREVVDRIVAQVAPAHVPYEVQLTS